MAANCIALRHTTSAVESPARLTAAAAALLALTAAALWLASITADAVATRAEARSDDLAAALTETPALLIPRAPNLPAAALSKLTKSIGGNAFFDMDLAAILIANPAGADAADFEAPRAVIFTTDRIDAKMLLFATMYIFSDIFTATALRSSVTLACRAAIATAEFGRAAAAAPIMLPP